MIPNVLADFEIGFLKNTLGGSKFNHFRVRSGQASPVNPLPEACSTRIYEFRVASVIISSARKLSSQLSPATAAPGILRHHRKVALGNKTRVFLNPLLSNDSVLTATPAYS